MAYPHGLISWTDISLPDPAGGGKFYADLFGWKADDQHDPDGNYIYTMFSKGGKSTAGMGAQPPGMAESGIPPMWNTYISVDDVEATLEKWTTAGGTVVMPIMDVFTSGRMAVVADPEGAVVSFWQAGDHVGGEVFNEHGALTWNELYSRDTARAREFYTAALGWEFEKLGGDDADFEYWMIVLPSKTPGGILQNDPYNGGLMTMDDSWPDDMPSHWMVYFQVDDTDDAVAQLERLGGRVSVPPFDTNAGRISVVGDPQGGTFSIITPAQTPSP
ncbi:MAG: VOC family protein [Acidimicrobiia bacterium]|nr:VOC family protein [Acidimicrobiia bacterium]